MTPRCLRCIGIGAGDQDPVLRIVGARVPDLLPGDGPLIAIPHRAGTERGHVRSSRRLGEELAPRSRTVDDAGEVALLLLGRAHDEEGRCHEEGGDAVRRPVGADGTDGRPPGRPWHHDPTSRDPRRNPRATGGRRSPSRRGSATSRRGHRWIPVLEPFGCVGRDVGHVHPGPACQERLSARQRHVLDPVRQPAAATFTVFLQSAIWQSENERIDGSRCA